MHVNVQMTGRSPLLMHNVQLADKDCEFTREIAARTSKKTNQTDLDRAEIARLEWQGGLYLENGKIVMPMANLIRAFRDAGVITRRGTDIQRCLIPLALNTPLIYKGSTDLNKLYADKSFVSRLPVKIGKNTVIRIRPAFPNWGLSADFELLEEIMDLRDLEAIIARAGLTTGLGDARKIGYGRFEAQVQVAEIARAAE